MDGCDFLEEFTSIKSNLKNKRTRYILSSSINQVDIEKSKTFKEVTDYLIKPTKLDHADAIFNSENDTINQNQEVTVCSSSLVGNAFLLKKIKSPTPQLIAISATLKTGSKKVNLSPPQNGIHDGKNPS
jgi:hypothetical protein